MSAPTPLVESLDVPYLVGKLMPGWSPSAPKVHKLGVQYALKAPPPGAVEIFLEVAALQDVKEVARLMEYSTKMRSIGPSRTDHSIGDEIRIWNNPSGHGGPVIFRRDNVLVHLSDGASTQSLVDLARRLDSAIVAGDPRILRTPKLTMPTIDLIDPPDSFAAGEEAVIALSIGPMPAATALLEAENTHVFLNRGTVPSITYYAPHEVGEDTITLLAATPGNLLTRKFFAMNIH